MTQRMKVTLLTFATMLVIYELLRLGFYLGNREYFAQAGAGEIAMAFVHGLRFDVSALIILNIPVLFLYNLPIPMERPKAWSVTLFALFAALNLAGIVLNIGDIGYFPSVQRRLLYEIYSNPEEVLHQVPGWFSAYPLLAVLVLGACGLFVFALARLLRRYHALFAPRNGHLRSLLCGILMIGLGALGIRGGFQKGILRPADAFKHSPSNAVGYLTLNSTYTVLLSAILRPLPRIRKMPEEEAERLAREMVAEDDEEFLDPKYPFLRRRTGEATPRIQNIMVCIMESWTWANVSGHDGGPSRTPFFDSLIPDGLLFTNFLATGQRSSEAVPSIVASVPSLFGRPIIGSRQELMRYRGLGSILGERGYSSAFHCGASKTVMGFDAFAALAGVQNYYCEADYPDRGPDTQDGRWGVYDELWFEDAVRRITIMPKPFMAFVFSLAPHDPWSIPPNRKEMFAPYADETGYQVTMRYSDFALRHLFDEARKHDWFDHTIFLITADHTRLSPPDSVYEAFHVPLLIYAPGRVAPGTDDRIGSQVDMLPTILDLLGLRPAHASLGRSLLRGSGPRWAVIRRDQLFAIFHDRWALHSDLDRDLGLFDFREDRFSRHDLAAEHPDVAENLRRHLFAYVQAVTTVVGEDRLRPPADR